MLRHCKRCHYCHLVTFFLHNFLVETFFSKLGHKTSKAFKRFRKRTCLLKVVTLEKKILFQITERLKKKGLCLVY